MICVEVHSNNVLTVRDNTFSNAVSDSVKHETVKFLFSDNWNDYQKTAVFSAEGVEPVNVILNGDNALCLSENECYIPHEVLKGSHFSISVFGVKGDSLATTPKVIIEVLESGYALGDVPQEPTASQYSQMMEIVEATSEIAQSVRNDANAGVFKGDKGDKGDPGPMPNLDGIIPSNTASGKSLYLNDVSPFAHECSCRLTSDTNNAGNLFMPTTENFSLNMTHTINSDGSILATGYTSGQGALICTLTGLIPNERYTFSLRSNNSSVWRVSIFGLVRPITASGNENIAFFEEYHATFVCPENGAVKIMIGQWEITDTTPEYDGSIIFYPQLELGNTMTEWKPYSEPKPYIEDFSTVKVFVGGKSYTPSENGTVIGIESISPNMEITTDNEHVTISDFTYLVDTKKYTDNLINDIKITLDKITEIQNSLIEGSSE